MGMHIRERRVMEKNTVTVNGTVYTILEQKEDIILVHLWDNELTPFVVWRLLKDGSCSGGDYAYNIEEAVQCFISRQKNTSEVLRLLTEGRKI